MCPFAEPVICKNKLERGVKFHEDKMRYMGASRDVERVEFFGW